MDTMTDSPVQLPDEAPDPERFALERTEQSYCPRGTNRVGRPQTTGADQESAGL